MNQSAENPHGTCTECSLKLNPLSYHINAVPLCVDCYKLLGGDPSQIIPSDIKSDYPPVKEYKVPEPLFKKSFEVTYWKREDIRMWMLIKCQEFLADALGEVLYEDPEDGKSYRLKIKSLELEFEKI